MNIDEPEWDRRLREAQAQTMRALGVHSWEDAQRLLRDLQKPWHQLGVSKDTWETIADLQRLSPTNDKQRLLADFADRMREVVVGSGWASDRLIVPIDNPPTTLHEPAVYQLQRNHDEQIDVQREQLAAVKEQNAALLGQRKSADDRAKKSALGEQRWKAYAIIVSLASFAYAAKESIMDFFAGR